MSNNEFKVKRFAVEFTRDGERKTGAPLYDTMRQAEEAARLDNKRFGGLLKKSEKAKAVEVDLTREVTLRAVDLANSAKLPRTETVELLSGILQLVQFVQRGY